MEKTVITIRDDFPTPDEVEYGQEVDLMSISHGDDRLDLMIEPYEADTEDREYQFSTYVLYVVKDGKTTDRICDNLPDFSQLRKEDVVLTMMDYFHDTFENLKEQEEMCLE